MASIPSLTPIKFWVLVISLISIWLTLAGCASRKVSRELTQVELTKNINPKREYLKVHLKSGNLYVLHSWKINESTNTITGLGNYLDFNRRILESRGSAMDNKKISGDFQHFKIPFKEIVVVETNDKGNNPGVAAIVITGLATVPIAVYCLTNPKACFGSCPTFYVHKDSLNKLVAEGFSSSISKSLEEKDIDLIDFQMNEGAPLQITVKNEALETHMIRSINLFACKKTPGSRVLQEAGGDFYQVSSIKSPIKADYKSASILKEIETKDQIEWYSLADSANLAKKEDIFLEFENPGKEFGLVIDKRQSLMTTYLFYHSLSLMGRATSYYISQMETRSQWLKKRITRTYDLLGGIEVSVLDRNNRWTPVRTVREAGPIVSDVHLVSLPENNFKTIKVRLRMAQGLWRINMVNLAVINKKIIPQRIAPDEVLEGAVRNQEALEKLLSENEYLVTYPGDVLQINYPGTCRMDHEYFIESQGYYIEWIREEWLKSEDLKAVNRILLNPSGYLKKMAPYYKAQEPEMEKIFWNSRYTTLEN